MAQQTKTRKTPDVAEALRELLRKDGAPTRYEISKATGIDQGTLSRFFHGGGIRLDSAEKIAEALGCELRLAKARKIRKTE